MTLEEMVKDYFLDKIMEDEDIELGDLIHDKKLDEDWVAEQEKRAISEALGGSKKALPDSDFEEIVTEKRD